MPYIATRQILRCVIILMLCLFRESAMTIVCFGNACCIAATLITGPGFHSGIAHLTK